MLVSRRRDVDQIDRDDMDLTVVDAGLGGDHIGAAQNCGNRTTQDGDFEAGFMVEMNMHRRMGQFVMMVLDFNKAAG